MFEVKVGMNPFLFIKTWLARVHSKQSLKLLQTHCRGWETCKQQLISRQIVWIHRWRCKDPVLSFYCSGWLSLKFDYRGAEVESDPPGESPRLLHDHNYCVLLVIFLISSGLTCYSAAAGVTFIRFIKTWVEFPNMFSLLPAYQSSDIRASCCHHLCDEPKKKKKVAIQLVTFYHS